jgi:hypothetical protein
MKMSKINKMNIDDIISHTICIGHFRTIKKRMLNLPMTFGLDGELGRLIGHLHGDGHVSHKSIFINYSNMEKLLVTNFNLHFNHVFGLSLTLCKNKSGLYSCSLRSKNYSWLIKKLINKIDGRSNLPVAFERGFFSALFDDETSFTVTNRRAHMHFGMKNRNIVNKAWKWLQKNGVKASNIYVDVKFRKNRFYYFYASKKQFKMLHKITEITSPSKCTKFYKIVEVVR